MASQVVRLDATIAVSGKAESVFDLARTTDNLFVEGEANFSEEEAKEFDGHAGVGILWSLGLEALAGLVLWGVWWGWSLWAVHP